MPPPPAPLRSAAPRSIDLDAAVSAVEQQLSGLAASLRLRDPLAAEAHANALQLALASAIDAFVAASRERKIPDRLRQRLARASAQVARLRETLARATAALDRVIEVLMPDAPARALYSEQGLAQSPPARGSLVA